MAPPLWTWFGALVVAGLVCVMAAASLLVP